MSAWLAVPNNEPVKLGDTTDAGATNNKISFIANWLFVVVNPASGKVNLRFFQSVVLLKLNTLVTSVLVELSSAKGVQSDPLLDPDICTLLCKFWAVSKNNCNLLIIGLYPKLP